MNSKNSSGIMYEAQEQAISLKEGQRMVGGYVECLTLSHHPPAVLLMNEDAQGLDLPLNPAARKAIAWHHHKPLEEILPIYGTCVLLRGVQATEGWRPEEKKT